MTVVLLALELEPELRPSASCVRYDPWECPVDGRDGRSSSVSMSASGASSDMFSKREPEVDAATVGDGVSVGETWVDRALHAHNSSAL